MNSKKKNRKDKTPVEQKIGQLIWGTVVIVLALIVFLGLIETAGPLGRHLTLGLKFILGWASWVMPIILAILSYSVFRLKEDEKIKVSFVIGIVLLIIVIAGLFHLYFTQDKLALQEKRGGGYVGFVTAWFLKQIFGVWASLVVLLAMLFIGVILAFSEFIRFKKKELPEEEEEKEEREQGTATQEFLPTSWWQAFQDRRRQKKSWRLNRNQRRKNWRPNQPRN